jgi:basic amino acid/polyamine antiporter, APA family
VRLAGPNGARWLTVLMMLSALGSLHANFLARPRVLYAMARDGRFFSIADRIQPTFRTPSGAILFHTCLAMLLVLTGTFEEIYSLGIFSIWIFVALTAVAVIRLRKKELMLPRPFRALGYPWTPVMVIAAALAMSANLWPKARGRPISVQCLTSCAGSVGLRRVQQLGTMDCRKSEK